MMSASMYACCVRLGLGLSLMATGSLGLAGCTSRPTGPQGYYTGSADYDSGGLPSRKQSQRGDSYMPAGGYQMDPKTGKLKYVTSEEELTNPEGIERKTPSRQP